jgi:23S rRNA (guanine745-N1)-methyltransferase
MNPSAEYAHILSCPVCSSPVSARVAANAVLVCEKGHSFDIARSGYANLLLANQKRSRDPGYDAPTLQARGRVFGKGFFSPLSDLLFDIAQRYATADAQREQVIVDAGCGEGSVLSRLISQFSDKCAWRVGGIGLDISRNGIEIAARRDKNALWCVTNVAKRIPLLPQTCSVILNVLAPANYPEFARILGPGKAIIKIVPLENHLRELRQLLYSRPRHEPMSDEKTMAEMRAAFTTTQRTELRYTVSADSALVADLIEMSPIKWKASSQALQLAGSIGPMSVTVDVSVITGLSQPA